MLIPQSGDKIKLLKDWSFTVYKQGNTCIVYWKFGKIAGETDFSDDEVGVITLPKNTILEIHDIHIKKGVQSHNNELTFIIRDIPGGLPKEEEIEARNRVHAYSDRKNNKFVIFTAKYKDCSNMEFSFVETYTKPRRNVKTTRIVQEDIRGIFISIDYGIFRPSDQKSTSIKAKDKVEYTGCAYGPKTIYFNGEESIWYLCGYAYDSPTSDYYRPIYGEY